MNLTLSIYLKRALQPHPKACEDRSLSLTAAQLSAVERSLTNPDIRVPLRADFPPVVSSGNPAALLAVIKAELAKCGETLGSIGELTIIYPNKDPRVFPGYSNGKGETASFTTMRALKAAWKQAGHAGALPAKLLRASMISETAYLDRSHNQGSLHALTKRQQYVARRSFLGKQIPFLSANHADKKHYFIIADQYIEQGTTVANLASYITHNGGHVLAAVHGDDGGTPLIPHNTFGPFEGQHAELKGVFAAASNNRSLAALGFFLARSAERDGIKVTRDEALQNVEAAINPYGHSLTALTHIETQRLIQSLQLRQITYAQVVALPTPLSTTTIKQHPARVPI